MWVPVFLMFAKVNCYLVVVVVRIYLMAVY
jgi:hypothetical protein